MMTPEQWADIRASAIWQEIVEPALLERQGEIDKLLRKVADPRTITLLQGGAAEIQTLLGDTEREKVRKQREAEHSKNEPVEVPAQERATDGRRPDERNSNRARRLFEQHRAGAG